MSSTLIHLELPSQLNKSICVFTTRTSSLGAMINNLAKLDLLLFVQNNVCWSSSLPCMKTEEALRNEPEINITALPACIF